MRKKLVGGVLKSNYPHKIKIRSVLYDDGANDTNKNFQYLEKNKIIPGIKVKSNSVLFHSKITILEIKKLRYNQRTY